MLSDAYYLIRFPDGVEYSIPTILKVSSRESERPSDLPKVSHLGNDTPSRASAVMHLDILLLAALDRFHSQAGLVAMATFFHDSVPASLATVCYYTPLHAI